MTDPSTAKSVKPFCSLAYLAKSTVAINSSSDVRIVHAPNTDSASVAPSLAHLLSPASASASSSSTPAKVNGERVGGNSNGTTCDSPDSGNADSSSSSSSSSSSPDDVFGVLNEEQSMLGEDQIDGVVDPRRPWELGGGLACLKRVPPSLMMQPNGIGGGGGGGVGNGGGPSLMSMSKMNSLDCWDYTIELECLNGPQDLQLAAELGKTLLERNKELETLLKDHKSTIEEQEQEIVYLKKHTTALREVNDSRLKVYEQLEVGIQDLERANHRLLVENTSDKKHIKTLVHSIETLESRCEELNKQLEETRQALSMERRKNERLLQERNGSGSDTGTIKLRPAAAKPSQLSDLAAKEGFEANTTMPENCSFAFQSPAGANNANSTGISGNDRSFDLSIECSGEDNEEIIKLVNDLETTKKAFVAEQQRCTELEEQLVAIIQENQTLQGRIAQSSANEEMKSMHEELSILDEVRQGQMCSRCLRAVEDRFTMNDEQSSIAPTEADDVDVEDRSLMELENMRDGAASEISQGAYRSGGSIKDDKAPMLTICPICFKTTRTTMTTTSNTTPTAGCPPRAASPTATIIKNRLHTTTTSTTTKPQSTLHSPRTPFTTSTNSLAHELLQHQYEQQQRHRHRNNQPPQQQQPQSHQQATHLLCDKNQQTISLESLLFDMWQKSMRKFRLLHWFARILQWPAIFLIRMINSVPEDEDFALMTF